MLRLLFVPSFFIIFHLSLEWLFFATKPSFLSRLSFSEKLLVFFNSIGFPVLAFLFFGSLLLLAIRIIFWPWYDKVVKVVWPILSAALFASCLFVLTNTFTYTLFGQTTLKEQGQGKIAAFLILGFIFLYSLRIVGNIFKEQFLKRFQFKIFLTMMLLCVASVFSCLVGKRQVATQYDTATPVFTPNKNLPDIILLSSDALLASYMSVYGHERETTPFLSEDKQNWLIFENVYSNANRSAGSILALLSGRSPLKTKVIAFPDILRGEDSLKHFAGVIRETGYRMVDISVRDYADVTDRNLCKGFDYASGRNLNLWLYKMLEKQPSLFCSDEFFFLTRIFRRLREHLVHTLYIERIVPQWEQVTKGLDHHYEDSQRIERLIDFLVNTDQPVFAHVHLLGTHGPLYNTKSKIFSRGREQKEHRDIDFYQDAIADFDSHIRRLVLALKERNSLEKTLIVIHSDHDRAFGIGGRIPLMWRFPGKSHTGTNGINAQLLDVAPTILDYLRAPSPVWLDGASLLDQGLKNDRLIVGVTDPYPLKNFYSPEPPYYNMETLELIRCDRKVSYYLRTKEIKTDKIQGHTAPCAENAWDDPEQIRRDIDQQLLLLEIPGR